METNFEIVTKGNKTQFSKKSSKQCLLPQLWKGAVVVMDNLPAHKAAETEPIIQSVGASVLYQSPYSPDFNQDRTLVVTT